jgi:hypothetical protein
MKDYGIDGVFVQRFVNNTITIRDLRDQVLQNVRYASEKHGRVFANMYDITGGDSAKIVDIIINDWKHLVDNVKILESPNYLHHKGRPVLSLWGIGHHEVSCSPEHAHEIIQWLTVDAPEKYRVTIKGGMNTRWRTQPEEWQEVYRRYEIFSPWTVGRYKSIPAYDDFKEEFTVPDLARAEEMGKDYMPVVWPGFSWVNNKPFKPDGVTPNVLNDVPRDGGKYFWHQIYNAIEAGADMIYVAMFDEVDEGTAIYKLAENTDQDPVETEFITMDMDGYDIPSDWYLRLTGEASKMLRGEVPLSPAIPIIPTVSGAKIISQDVPEKLSPGEILSVSITVENTGHTSWTKDDGFKLGSQNEQDNTIWGINRVDLEEGETIAPGETKTFTFDIKAPSKEKVYSFRWRMMQEGVNWFGFLTENKLIKVTK